MKKDEIKTNTSNYEHSVFLFSVSRSFFHDVMDDIDYSTSNYEHENIIISIFEKLE